MLVFRGVNAWKFVAGDLPVRSFPEKPGATSTYWKYIAIDTQDVSCDTYIYIHMYCSYIIFVQHLSLYIYIYTHIWKYNCRICVYLYMWVQLAMFEYLF